MPRRSPRGCLTPGCPNLAPSGQSYCPNHQAQQDKAYDQARGSPAQRGYGARWRRIRAGHLRRHPNCVDPFAVHDTLMRATDVDHIVVHDTLMRATDVDHIVPKSEGGTDHEDNLQSLCHACHSRKTAVRDGRWG